MTMLRNVTQGLGPDGLLLTWKWSFGLHKR